MTAVLIAVILATSIGCGHQTESNGTKPAHTGSVEPAEPRADDEHRAGREQR